MPRNPNCARCGKKLSKPRLAANKRKCYLCEIATRRESKQKAHDRAIESEDFTAEDYWRLYEAQGGKCAIFNCRATGKSKHLAVEHDHSCKMGHPPNKWCRVCARGLTCGMHNEWIGRAGDDPEVFDDIADYLRDPPARKILMENMIAGTAEEIVNTLATDYRVPVRRAIRMLDNARGVGPSPTHLRDCTIVIRYIRMPRAEAIYEIIESEPWLKDEDALKMLMAEYGFTDTRAKKALNAVWSKGKQGKLRARVKGGSIRITYRGRGANQAYMFSIEKVR